MSCSHVRSISGAGGAGRLHPDPDAGAQAAGHAHAHAPPRSAGLQDDADARPQPGRQRHTGLSAARRQLAADEAGRPAVLCQAVGGRGRGVAAARGAQGAQDHAAPPQDQERYDKTGHLVLGRFFFLPDHFLDLFESKWLYEYKIR